MYFIILEYAFTVFEKANLSKKSIYKIAENNCLQIKMVKFKILSHII